MGHNVDWSRCEAYIWERYRLLVDWAIEALARSTRDRARPRRRSKLLRTWVLAGIRSEQGDSIGATLTDLEQGLRRLRKALG